MMVVPHATVESSKASQKTRSRRTKLINQFRAVVTANDTVSQLQCEVRGLGKEARQELLRSAGVTLEIPPEAGLAMKADCSLPWLRLRKIRRYIHTYTWSSMYTDVCDKKANKQVSKGLGSRLQQ